MASECRILNLAVQHKKFGEDCANAESSLSFREIIKSSYFSFNIMKSEKLEEVKKIKKVLLYPGQMLGKDAKQEVVGGIAVVYELKNGEDF